MTVNHDVVGSIPTAGAYSRRTSLLMSLLMVGVAEPSGLKNKVSH